MPSPFTGRSSGTSVARILSSFRVGSKVARKSRAASIFPERLLRQEGVINVQLRQQVDELLRLLAIWLRRDCALGGLELAFSPCLQRGQFAEAASDLGACVRIGLQGLQVGHLSSDPSRELTQLRLPLGLLVVCVPLRIGLIQSSREPLPPPWTEQVRPEELDHGRDGAVLPHVDHLWVLGRDEGGLATRGLADVVGHPVALAPVHPQTAGPAPEKGPQQIGPWGVVGTGRRGFVTLSRETERRSASSNISRDTSAS